MITLALAISTVALGGHAIILHRRAKTAWKVANDNWFKFQDAKRELDNESASNGQVLQRKNELIGEMHLKLNEYSMARDVAEGQASAAWDQARNFEARYHAALRALRTRQEVVESLARERDWLNGYSERTEARFWTMAAVAQAEVKKANRRAAQLKRLKARKT